MSDTDGLPVPDPGWVISFAFSFAACMLTTALILAVAAVRALRPTKEPTT